MLYGDYLIYVDMILGYEESVFFNVMGCVE